MFSQATMIHGQAVWGIMGQAPCNTHPLLGPQHIQAPSLLPFVQNISSRLFENEPNEIPDHLSEKGAQ